MLHGDEPLFHAIVSAHRDPDPGRARLFNAFSPAPPPRRIAALLPLTEGRPARRPTAAVGLVGAPGFVRLSRLTEAFSSLLGAVLRPLQTVRARHTGPCVTPGCP